MNAISIETNIGSCALKVSAEINEQEILKSMKAFGEFLIWHNGASKTYSGGKKAEFKRDDPFSDKLGNKACESVVEVLGKHGFVNIICEASAQVKLSEEAKFIQFAKKLGMDENAAKAGWETANAKMLAKTTEAKASEEKVVS